MKHGNYLSQNLLFDYNQIKVAIRNNGGSLFKYSKFIIFKINFTIKEGVQYPQTINMTLHLHKPYDITYVRLKFVSPRPESFAIYKKSKSSDEWIPWQYYRWELEETERERQGRTCPGDRNPKIEKRVWGIGKIYP